jgi:addiction module HigA family antidote
MENNRYICNQVSINSEVMVQVKDIDQKKIAYNMMPSEPVHPGEAIKDELEYRGVSQRKFAESVGISYSIVNEVLNGKRAVTTEYALLFEAALGIDADIWLRMQSAYNKQMVIRNKSFMKRLADVRRVASML